MISTIALTVSACGGGGGGGGSATASPMNMPGGGAPSIPRVGTTEIESSVYNSIVSTPGGEQGNLRNELSAFGTQTGSQSPAGVYQTSNQNSQPALALVTGNSISDLRINLGSSGTLQESGPNTRSATVDGVQRYKVSYFNTNPTDDSLPGATRPKVEGLLYSKDGTTSTSTDYLGFGYWVKSENDTYAPDDTEVGIFSISGGAQTPIAYLHPSTTVTAKYQGDATGMMFSLGDSTAFTGKIGLDATFSQGSSSIGGKMTDINLSADIGNTAAASLPLNFGTAMIPQTVGGFFSGEVDDDIAISGSLTTGKWFGRFHGDSAERLIGGLSFNRRILGHFGFAVFGAEKE